MNSWAEEIAHWLKSLVGKSVKLSLIPRTHVKSWVSWHTLVILEPGKWRQAELWGSLTRYHILLGKFWKSEKLHPNRKWWLWLKNNETIIWLSHAHVYKCAHTHTVTYAQKMTHTYIHAHRVKYTHRNIKTHKHTHKIHNHS